ncbi:SH3 domain-binding protein 5-like isoform X2 [Brienomyrus brachyistius]|uniref:SH3 domain-binding protein 5-like isoform X2 n=1 Tax=Brienomyrus brachyistius TaxID=42636 RepID=UPI0020B3DECC|nr:SH3 domain-binding protein 5-like isoform X2 [Brienomyrus brachyistius]
MDSSQKGNKSEGDSESQEEEEVDPRIQGELEKLNQSTDEINRWETELEEGRQKFRAVLVEATVKLDDQVNKIGKAVEESKPYWEARRAARQAQLEAQRATQDYQGATEVLRAAKETIALAEQRLLEEDSRQFDSAWQEMLNHATQRVMEAEQTKTNSEKVHKETAAKYNAAIGHMKALEKRLKRTISKSKPYFELKAKYYFQLEQLKTKVDERQAKLNLAKGEYRAALRSLEMISNEIHARRRSMLTECRGCGVGAEGDNGCGDGDDEIANFRMESDGISVTSVTFEDESGSDGVSSPNMDTPFLCSFSLLPASDTEHTLPSSSPSSSSSSSCSQPSTLGDLTAGVTQPALGPRGQCSGASSPECDSEPVLIPQREKSMSREPAGANRGRTGRSQQQNRVSISGGSDGKPLRAAR